jgi:mono/diheme cytochrome c family protein
MRPRAAPLASRWRHRLAPPLAGAVLVLLAATAAAQPLSETAQTARGRALYFNEGNVLQAAAPQRDGAPLPGAAAACVNCHRRSGLGGAEGPLLVPPIAGDFLFNPLSPQTGKRLPWPSRDRTRPAYDLATLGAALRSGVAPDGVALRAPMPHYALPAADVAALASYLRTLSAERAPGVSDDEVVLATITTPDVPAAEVDDLLRTLTAFFADKNAGSRSEMRRRAQALRNDDTMYRRYRRWRLVHWALEGPPSTWDRQLAQRYAQTPVFAVISGISYDTWEPIHAFCEQAQLPCLVPTAWLPPAREEFYSVYLSPGLPAQARALGEALVARGVREVAVWTMGPPAGPRQRDAIRAALAQAGVRVLEREARAGDVVVSALPLAALAAHRAALEPQQLFVLDGALGTLPDRWQRDAADALAGAVIVTDQAAPGVAARQLTRARMWVSARRITPSSERVAVNALLAATIAVETLMHVDDKFSREYCIEKLEHNLENLPPLTAYPRLAIGPGQRFATRHVALLPAAGDGGHGL